MGTCPCRGALGLWGRKLAGVWVGGVGSRTLPSPSAVQEKQVASGDEGGVLGAGGSESSVLTFPLHPLNVRGLLMRWRRVKHSPAPEG